MKYRLPVKYQKNECFLAKENSWRTCVRERKKRRSTAMDGLGQGYSITGHWEETMTRSEAVVEALQCGRLFREVIWLVGVNINAFETLLIK